MSWYVDDPTSREAAHRFNDPRLSPRKGHARAKAMMHPDDLTKIAFMLIAGTAAVICIFTLRLLAAGLGG